MEECLRKGQVGHEENEEKDTHVGSHLLYHFSQMVSLINQPQVVKEVEIQTKSSRGLNVSSNYVLALQTLVLFSDHRVDAAHGNTENRKNLYGVRQDPQPYVYLEALEHLYQFKIQVVHLEQKEDNHEEDIPARHCRSIRAHLNIPNQVDEDLGYVREELLVEDKVEHYAPLVGDQNLNTFFFEELYIFS